MNYVGISKIILPSTWHNFLKIPTPESAKVVDLFWAK